MARNTTVRCNETAVTLLGGGADIHCEKLILHHLHLKLILTNLRLDKHRRRQPLHFRLCVFVEFLAKQHRDRVWGRDYTTSWNHCANQSPCSNLHLQHWTCVSEGQCIEMVLLGIAEVAGERLYSL